MFHEDFMDAFSMFMHFRKVMNEHLREQMRQAKACADCPNRDECFGKCDPDADIHVEEIHFKRERPEYSEATEEALRRSVDQMEDFIHKTEIRSNGSILAQRARKPRTFYYEFTDVVISGGEDDPL